MRKWCIEILEKDIGLILPKFEDREKNVLVHYILNKINKQ